MFVPRCRGCATEFARHEASGRVLYPIVLPLVIMLVLAALRLDDALRPPLWVHALVWPPVVAVVIIGALRLVKLAWVMRAINPPRDGEGDHAQHGGGAARLGEASPGRAGSGASSHGLHNEAPPLHHPAGGPPPRAGED
ncbi:DUF983 domain-containing protein [Novosphingobium sp.]|uniref:DUF983 domain-containing protein n=1 Tax=Novosphingobium sp. TaxID=1874826 RepID=UPI003B5262D4